MAEFMAKLYSSSAATIDRPQLVKSQVLNLKRFPKKITKRQPTLTSQAVEFKYRHNLPSEDLEAIRRLLTCEQSKLSKEEKEFNKHDFERMLRDDWLVTRFLLRGIKLSQNSAPPTGATRTQTICAQTLALIGSCAKFRHEFNVNAVTCESEFPLDWRKVEGLFKYKPDLVGNPTVYLRVALHKPNLIETSELRHLFKRFMLYTLEQCDQDLDDKQGKAICCVFDMSNASFENIDLELMTWMVKSFKSCGPKLVCYVIIYNSPWFLAATFKLICTTLLSGNKKQTLKFVQGEEILSYIDFNNLPGYIQANLN